MKTPILLLSCFAFALHTFAEVPASAEKTSPLKEGAKAPEVAFRNPEGESVSLKALQDDGPVVLVFYRGGWCPYCTRHLSELQTIKEDLKKEGWKMVAVSPDKPEKLAESLKELEVDYTLVSDSDMSAAKTFGIAFQVDEETVEKYKTYKIDLVEASGKPHQQLPVPSVFLIGKDGKIVYAYTNPDYKVRLSAEEVMEKVAAASRR